MCTIAILVNACDAALALAANRDELYARASRPPERVAPGIACGVDAVGGGTWLAVRADGGFAAVTNQLGATAPPGARSRGVVVRELAAASDPEAYVAALDPRAYASMNLVWGDARRGAWISYLRREGTTETMKLADGVHVLCNDRLERSSSAGPHRAADGPRGGSIESGRFARGTRLHDRIARQLAASPRWDALVAALPAMLGDHTQVASAADAAPGALPAPLTANCIHTPTYGTRCATLAAFDPGDVRTYLHADGPPCVTLFVDRRELLR